MSDVSIDDLGLWHHECRSCNREQDADQNAWGSPATCPECGSGQTSATENVPEYDPVDEAAPDRTPRLLRPMSGTSDETTSRDALIGSLDAIFGGQPDKA